MRESYDRRRSAGRYVRNSVQRGLKRLNKLLSGTPRLDVKGTGEKWGDEMIAQLGHGFSPWQHCAVLNQSQSCKSISGRFGWNQGAILTMRQTSPCPYQ